MRYYHLESICGSCLLFKNKSAIFEVLSKIESWPPEGLTLGDLVPIFFMVREIRRFTSTLF